MIISDRFKSLNPLLIDNDFNAEEFFITIRNLNKYNDRQYKDNTEGITPQPISGVKKKRNMVKITDSEVV